MGLVEISYNSSVQEITMTEIKIKKNEEVITFQNDFVFTGAEMPHKFLMSLGVQIEKKFSEGLG